MLLKNTPWPQGEDMKPQGAISECTCLPKIGMCKSCCVLDTWSIISFPNAFVYQEDGMYKSCCALDTMQVASFPNALTHQKLEHVKAAVSTGQHMVSHIISKCICLLRGWNVLKLLCTRHMVSCISMSVCTCWLKIGICKSCWVLDTWSVASFPDVLLC
jgi:hypothetical protein